MIERNMVNLDKAHESVAGAESDLVNRRERFPVELRTIMEQNYRLCAADYGRDHVTEVRAARAVRRAEVFVAAVAVAERGGHVS